MAEYTNTVVQTVEADGNVLFAESPCGCSRGYITHRVGSGIFRLRGCATSACKSVFRVWFGGNVAVSTGGTATPISIALTLDGEVLGSSEADITAVAVGDFSNVSVAAYITVERGCCATVAVQNTSDQSIDVRGSNLIIERIA